MLLVKEVIKKPLKLRKSLDRTEEVVQELVTNGSKSMRKVMQEVGYSQAYSIHPEKLKATNKFQKLLKKYLPEKSILAEHGGLIHAGKLDHYTFPATDTDEMIAAIFERVPGSKLVRIHANQQWKRAYFLTSDNDAKLRAIEMAYKLQGRLGKSSEGTNAADPSEEVREVLVRIRQILPHSKTG